MSSWPLWVLVLAVVIAGPMVGGPVLRPARQLQLARVCCGQQP